jgi:Mg-chelatase subunit ChlD
MILHRISSIEMVKGIVEKKLHADGGTNMRAGLETGLRVLAGRQLSSGRVASIILMSDGQDSLHEPRAVDTSGVAVYTFGFGADQDAEVHSSHTSSLYSLMPFSIYCARVIN